jgi:hypothetical protein
METPGRKWPGKERLADHWRREEEPIACAQRQQNNDLPRGGKLLRTLVTPAVPTQRIQPEPALEAFGKKAVS